jgi:hypothetical protein
MFAALDEVCGQSGLPETTLNAVLTAGLGDHGRSALIAPFVLSAIGRPMGRVLLLGGGFWVLFLHSSSW